jgi:nucleoside-diphosphate-sugar epimerase
MLQYGLDARSYCNANACALECPCCALQETLAANFEGTGRVLELAAAAGHLKALVHVSSAFVNMNQPRSSIVDEQVYPLKYGHQTVDVEELARVSPSAVAAAAAAVVPGS